MRANGGDSRSRAAQFYLFSPIFARARRVPTKPGRLCGNVSAPSRFSPANGYVKFLSHANIHSMPQGKRVGALYARAPARTDARRFLLEEFLSTLQILDRLVLNEVAHRMKIAKTIIFWVINDG